MTIIYRIHMWGVRRLVPIANNLKTRTMLLKRPRCINIIALIYISSTKIAIFDGVDLS